MLKSSLRVFPSVFSRQGPLIPQKRFFLKQLIFGKGEQSVEKQEEGKIIEHAEIAENLVQKSLASSQELPNTRGKFREQLCRTPLLGTSVKKLNHLAHLIKGLSVEQAMLQMMFVRKDDAKEILWALKEGANIAEEVQNIDKRNLFVSWVMCNKGPYKKSVTFHGRGRTGRKRTPSAYMIVMLREKAFKDAYEKVPKYMTRVPRPRPDKRITHPKIKL